MKKILVTGGSGKIGSHFVKFAASKYQLRIVDLYRTEVGGEVESIVADLTNYKRCLELCDGIDTVIHLAGNPSPNQSFNEVLTNNIVPNQNIYAAAHEKECNRIIFASSAQTIEAYPTDVQVNPSMQVRPKNLYGVSKCFGEALASYYAYTKGLPSICLRIGAFEFPEDHETMNTRDLSAFLHPDDMNQLLMACVEAKDIKFEILNAISDNTYKRLDISQTLEQINYKPKEDAFDIFNIL